MKRKLLIVLLGLGTVIGYGAGCARMHAHGHHSHARFEDRVADVCAAAAHRVYDGRSTQAPSQPLPPATVFVPFTMVAPAASAR